ncbi:MAG: tRNA (guanosine(37)-N1)-methyltransferase TrmD [Clostridia bacterium]
MIFDIVTLFPEVVGAPLQSGVIAKARESGLIRIRVHNLRDFATGRHRVTDEPPYGGGPGMVMKPQPFFRAVEFCTESASEFRVILPTPQGRKLDQKRCEELARERQLVILCPRYEGVDERVRQWAVTDEISLGDFVLSGGEIPAVTLVEAVGRLIPGVLGGADSAESDSFSSGLLEGPQYTRPRVYRSLRVPDVLLSGDHGKVRRWRREAAIRTTLQRRPDLLSSATKCDYHY